MSADAPRFKLKPKRLPPPLLRAVLRSAVFLASAVLLCERLLLPLEVPAMAVVAQLAAQGAGAGEKPELAVLKIDPWTFREKFGGMQPLNRCALKCYVEQLLVVRKDLVHLALDLDLSPTGKEEQDDCATDILRRLQAEKAKGLQSTLILPVDGLDRAESVRWRAEVQAAGVALADPRVVREFGVVRSHWKQPGRCPTLGQALDAQPPAAAAACFDPRRDVSDADMSEGEQYMVAYHALIRHAWVPGPDADGKLMRLSDQIAALPPVKRVILGAHFDASDEHLTPIGPLAGVEVHAAVALAPDEAVHHAWGWLIDVAFGLLCGLGAHALWARYFNQLLGTAHGPPTVSDQALAYLWPSLLAVVWLVLAVAVLPLVSLCAVLWKTVWINPVPMLVGMTVDAFMLGSVASAIHHAGHGLQPLPDPPRGAVARLALGVLARLPALVWWLVVGLAMVSLALHKTPVELLLLLT